VLLAAALMAVAPFSIDAYLPAFPQLAREFGADPALIQQTLTAYFVPYCFMMLWHGALSDALGRRRPVLVCLAIYIVGSLVCANAQSIEWLLVGRAVQGVSAGAGVAVARAMVRDLTSGAEAQIALARVTTVFALAPAIAPMVGGVVLLFADWRAIFAMLAIMASVLWLVCAFKMPESLPMKKRQSLRPSKVLRNFGAVLRQPAFRRAVIMVALIFGGFFIYVLCAPALIVNGLGLSAQSFGWLFVPSILGLMAGAQCAAYTAKLWTPHATIWFGLCIMLGAAVNSVAFHLMFPPALPWSVLPVAVYQFGSGLVMPALSLQALDAAPMQRGMASSLQAFCQLALVTLLSAFVAPWANGSPLRMALVSLACAGAATVLHYLGRPNQRVDIKIEA
jgi:MFS transporter, DHA1 family, multidrug resistance protein